MNDKTKVKLETPRCALCGLPHVFVMCSGKFGWAHWLCLGREKFEQAELEVEWPREIEIKEKRSPDHQ